MAAIFTAKFNLTTSTGSGPYAVTGNVISNASANFDATDVAIGDIVYLEFSSISGATGDIGRYRVTAITSAVGTALACQLTWAQSGTPLNPADVSGTVGIIGRGSSCFKLMAIRNSSVDSFPARLMRYAQNVEAHEVIEPNLGTNELRELNVGIADATQTAAKSTEVELVSLGGDGSQLKKGRIQFGHYLNADGFVNATGSENMKWRGLRLSVNSAAFTGGGNDDPAHSNMEMTLENGFASVQIPVASVAWNGGTSATRVTFGAPAWSTGFSYIEDNCVQQGGNTYRCKTAHTSGTFATDLSNALWVLLFSGAGTVNLLSTSGLASGYPVLMKGFIGAGSTLLNKLNSGQLKTKTYHGVDDGYIDLDLDTSTDNFSGLSTASGRLWSVSNEYWFGANSWRPFFMAGDSRAGQTSGLLNLAVPLSVFLPSTFAPDGNNYTAVFQSARAIANGTHILVRNTANLGQCTLSIDGGQDGVDRSTWVIATDNHNATADLSIYNLRPKFVASVLRLKDGGNVGIGVSAPEAKLDVNIDHPAWLTATAYSEAQIVEQAGSTYYCKVAHTSGTFATDLAANKWSLLFALAMKVTGRAAITADGSGYACQITNTGANLGLAVTSATATPQYNIVSGASTSTTYGVFEGYVNSGTGDRQAIAFTYHTGDGGNGTTGTTATIQTSADGLVLTWGTGAGGAATRSIALGTTNITLPSVINEIVAPAAELQFTGSLSVTGTLRADGSIRHGGYTSAERDALVGPAGGTMLYNETTGKMNFFNAVAGVWEAITSAAV